MTQTVPVVFLACKVFEGVIRETKNTTFLDYGLHVVPKKLNVVLQEQIDAIEEPSLVILGYGLCGNALNNIHAGKHTLVVPKADDCVAIFMGSRQRFLDQFDNNPGTYYLTKGWFEVGSDPLSQYEELLPKYGQDTTDWVMEQQFQHYKRLVFVSYCEEDLDIYRPRALEVAAYCERFGMVYEEYLGNEDFIKQIATALESQDPTAWDCVVVQPGEVLHQELFE